MTNKKKLLNIQELSEIYGFKQSKVRSMVFKKEIPFLKIGRLVFFDPEELKIWLDSKKRGTNE